MAKNRIICEQNQVEYSTIRRGMCQGARTIEDLKASVNICGECEGCKSNMEGIITSICGCKGVSMKSVIDTVNAGVTDIEEIGRITGAGTGEGCGRCKSLIANIIELGY